MRFAKNLRPGTKTQYGVIVSNQLMQNNRQVCLIIKNTVESIILNRYSLIRTYGRI